MKDRSLNLKVFPLCLDIMWETSVKWNVCQTKMSRISINTSFYDLLFYLFFFSCILRLRCIVKPAQLSIPDNINIYCHRKILFPKEGIDLLLCNKSWVRVPHNPNISRWTRKYNRRVSPKTHTFSGKKWYTLYLRHFLKIITITFGYEL